MLDFHSQAPSERIIVALDGTRAEALACAEALQGVASWLKVGMTLFYQEGPRIIEELHNQGFKVFLDLKFHDIPHQVHGATLAACKAGADMITLHASGGLAMMQAAAQAVREYTPPVDVITLGVTVLTSMDARTLHSVGVLDEPKEQIERLAKLVAQANLRGVVCSPHEAAVMRELLGPQAYIVTPGVRPQGASLDDQSRVMTPQDAFEQGASHLVIGRPITAHHNPRAAFDEVVASVKN